MKKTQKRIISSALLCGMLFTGMPGGQLPILAAPVHCSNSTLGETDGKILIGAINGSGEISSVHLNYTSTFMLKVFSGNHGTEKYKFTSSDESVLMVTEEGLVIPCSDGSCMVSVMTEDGRTDDCDFYIEDSSTFDFKLFFETNSSSISGFTKGYEVSDLHLPQSLQRCELKTITENAFADTTQLTSVTLQPALENIQARAFANCENLKTIIIQNPDAIIDDTAFGNFSNGEDVPYNLTIKGYEGSTAETFAEKYDNITFVPIDKENDNLTASTEKVFLSANQKLIEDNIYLGVNTSEKIYADAYVVKEENQQVTFSSSDEDVAVVSEDGILTGKKSGTATITASTPNGISKSFEVKIVKDIEVNNNSYTFAEDGNLILNKYNDRYSYGTLGFSSKFIKTDIIGQEAVEGNTNIVNVNIANGVSRIEGRAFANCTNLKSLKIPSTVTYIDDTAFGDFDNGDTAYSLTIYGECGSVAEKLAEKYENITFIRNNSAMHSDCPKATVEPTAEPTEEPVVKVTEQPIAKPMEEPTVKATEKPTMIQSHAVVEKGVKTSNKNQVTKKTAVKKTKIKFTAKKAKLKVGSKYRFKVAVTGTKKTVKWSVSNKKVASINKKTGKLTAKKSGKVIVKATCNNVTKTFKVTIRK